MHLRVLFLESHQLSQYVISSVKGTGHRTSNLRPMFDSTLGPAVHSQPDNFILNVAFGKVDRWVRLPGVPVKGEMR